MTKVVFITQQVDPRHPALAATVPKIRALADLVDEVVVLADGAVEGVLPDNCRVRTFRAGFKAIRGARFEASLARELGGLRGGAVVAHMCPIYAVLAAPLVRPLGVPLVLWFTHWRRSRLLEPRRARVDGSGECRRALVPARDPEAACDRTRHRPRRVPVLAPARGRRDAPARARPLLDREGARRRRRGGAARGGRRDTGRVRAVALDGRGSSSRRARAGRRRARPRRTA